MHLAELIDSSKNVLTFSGIWPKKNPSIFYKFKTLITATLSIVLSSCMLINAGYHSENFLTVSESLYLTLSVMNAVPKELILVFKRKQFHTLLHLLDTPSFTKYLTVYTSDFKDYLKTNKIVTFFFRAQVIGFLIGTAIFPVIEGNALPVDFPFFNNGTFHYPFYIFEMFAISSAAFHSMTVDLLVTGTFSIAAVQLKILNKKLMHMNTNIKMLDGYSDDKIEEYTFNYLRECCIHYSDIEKFIRNIVQMFSGAFFFQLSTSAMSICNAGFIITLTPFSIEAVIVYCYLGALSIQLGLYCWFGNDIYFESGLITNSCYMSQWYERGPKVRKAIIILMERCKRPLEIKGLNYISLSFPTFLIILKWSYSYFTLLRKFNFNIEGSNIEI